MASREIRLVKILKVSRNAKDPIRCQFFKYPLEQCPPYMALSYTWGVPKVHDHILLGRHYIPVRRNLFHFLLQKSKDLARSPRRYEFYWIDALSIDQDSTTERNHQVGLMKDIYSNAEGVEIWLGKASPRAERVINFIEKYASRWRFFPSFRSDPAKSFHACLCNHAYWSRAWIIQEIILAKKINICWGEHVFPWKNLDRIFNDLRTENGRHDLIPILSSPATTIFGFKSEWEKPIPLIKLLDTFRYQKSIDVRDKIYAFLGLASEDSKVDVDYSKSLEEVRNDVLLKAHAVGHLRTKSDAEYHSRVLLAVFNGHFDETDVNDLLRYKRKTFTISAKTRTWLTGC